MLKKFNIILLLILLFIQTGFLFYFFKSIQLAVKNHIQSDLEKKESEFFTLTFEEFNSIKLNEKEFLYNNFLYDIQKLEIHNNIISISAYRDENETDIFNLLKKLLKIFSSKDFNKHLNNLLTITYTNFNLIYSNIPTLFNQELLFIYQLKSTSDFKSINLPPPKFL